MRMILLPALLLAASPAAAWEFTPGLPCILSQTDAPLEVTLTHDPSAPLYSITLRRAEPWPTGGIFSISFAGGQTITTNRQVLSEGGLALTVSDRGFGNVLGGMITSPFATARLGDIEEEFSLEGAAEPVLAFEACEPLAAA